MSKPDFAGQNGFVWFTGVIATKQDKAQVGRLRVRIIGWHSEDENTQPDDELPWAQILMSTNNSKTISLPKPGDWVFGFFQDGERGQHPVVIGVYPRIVTQKVRKKDSSSELLSSLEKQLEQEKKTLASLQTGLQTLTRTKLIEKQKKVISGLEKQISLLKTTLSSKSTNIWDDRRTQKEINDGPNPPDDVVLVTEGEPSLSKSARGVYEGTLIQRTNNDRKHVCDITGQLVPVVLYLKTKYGLIATQIREFIREILKKLGWDPSGESSALVSFIKKITNFLNAVSEMLEEILDWKRLLVDVAAAAKAMIDYIMSLPERLYNLFKKCLKSLYKQLYAAFKLITDIGNDEISETDKELKDAIKQLEDAGNVLKKQTVELINTPQEIVDTLTKPASAETLAEIDALILELTPSEDDVTSDTGFDKTKVEAP